ncbi:MAG: translocation/assembly module TamB domain-containing protein, partial [Flavobacteriaceae bacterium]
RILIDGKVGVPVGGEDETMIIGNVTLEFLLNPQGTLRARVFNKENEFQYFGDELGYTQGVGIAYQVRFNSLNELVRKIFNKK